MSTPDAKSRFSFCLFVAIVFVVSIQFPLQPSALGQDDVTVQEQQRFDGNWWKKSDSDERIGFLYALDDCLTFDTKPARGFDDSWINYERKISRFYDASSSQLTTPIQSVFENFGKGGALAQKAHAKGRYGDEFWRSHNEIARKGFIEGYLSCRVHQKNAPKWSQPVAAYVQKLDDLYNADDRHGEDAPEYTGSVASALEKTADPQ